MKTCPSCGEQNQDFAVFCCSCGVPFGADDAPFAAAGNDRAARRARRRLPLRLELIVGLSILLIALLYAGYDWLHRAQAATAYQNGLVASRARDWDRAAASFSEAGDYGDAPRLAENALHNALQRDRYYAQAIAAQKSGDLWTALQALGQVSAIQPGYRDSAARSAQVRQVAHTTGMAGVVYLSIAQDQPGLYLIDEHGGHNYLPGSDAASQLRAADNGSALVYDGPAKVGGARQLLLARFAPDGEVSSTTIAQLDSQGAGVFTAGGFWWYNGSQIGSREDTEVYFVDTSRLELRLSQLSDLPAGRRVLAVAPGGGKVLLAVNQPVRGGFSTSTQLYLGNADGTQSRSLGKVVGAVYQAALSYDGRWAIYVMQQGTAITARSVWSLALDGGAAKATLLDSMSSSADTATYLNAWLFSGKERAARVMILKYYNTIDEMSIRDLESGLVSTKWSDSIVHRSGLSFSASGDFLLSRELQGAGQTISLFSTSLPQSRPLQLTLPGLEGQLIDVQMAPRDDFIVVTAEQPVTAVDNAAAPVETPRSSFSVPLNQGGSLGTIRKLGNVSALEVGGRNNTVLPPLGLLVASINPLRQLQASFYDGSDTTVVAKDVAAVWRISDQ